MPSHAVNRSGPVTLVVSLPAFPFGAPTPHNFCTHGPIRQTCGGFSVAVLAAISGLWGFHLVRRTASLGQRRSAPELGISTIWAFLFSIGIKTSFTILFLDILLIFLKVFYHDIFTYYLVAVNVIVCHNFSVFINFLIYFYIVKALEPPRTLVKALEPPRTSKFFSECSVFFILTL